MKVRRSLLKDQVTVTTRTGEGAYGPIHAAAQIVLCNIDETRRLVRDAAGDEQVSEATLILHPTTRVLNGAGVVVGTVDPLAAFTPESPVTIRDRATRVLAAKPHTLRGRTVAVEVTCG